MEQLILPEPKPEPTDPAVPSYPTIAESWGALGWFVLCTLVAALLILLPASMLFHQQNPAKQLTTAVAAEGGLLLTIWWLARRAGTRWPRLGGGEQAASWRLYVLLLLIMPAQAVVLTTLSLLPLPDWTGKTFIDWSRYPVLAFGIGSIVGPVLEEYLFRGVLLQGLLRNYRPWVAIAQSALLFGVFHFNPAQSLSATLMGLVVGWLYYRTQSLGLCIGLHALNNAFAFTMLRFSSTPRYVVLSNQLGAAGYWALVALAAMVLSGCLWWLHRQLPATDN
ncbi:CPBP family intramembrane glutamic endopeptidase [Hymenobacter sp. BT559]|uniref:CPBP family intramembrane glutamic endopeptidase n=1 Tax=Hymenobacter sp. BT559 TaxID=2795729 RepID=UPI0018EAF136|nr:type II CAAX endopeptidase family protein [Hymenobacter sp. BT559]MBJ6143334.1 CPBP family intramembrane metalloprotease [Hymenobacter sp. BT559]